MIALFSATMAFAATDTLYVWDGNGLTSATGLVQKGGEAEAIQASGTNIVAGAGQKGNWCFKVNKGFSSGQYYIGIALEKGVSAGDVINIGFFRTTENSTYVLGMDFSADKASAATTYQILSKGNPQVISSSTGIPVDSVWVVPEGVSNAKYIRIYRNSGSTGTWVSKFVVKREAGEPEPEPTEKTFYLTLSSDWAGWPAKYAIYTWKEGVGDLWVEMNEVEGEENLYKASIPVDNDKLIFVRLNGEATELNWDNKWSKTIDLDFPTEDVDHFTVTSGGTGEECNGEWSKYVAPVPVEDVKLYYVNTTKWEKVQAYVWKGESDAYKSWPGEEMKKEEEQIYGNDVYSYEFPENYENIIFNDGTNQSPDLTWSKSKPYFYNGEWYAKANIPEPIPAAVPLEGNIWKVTSETPVRAGSHYIDEALLKMDGVYQTTLKSNTRTIAGEEFTHAIQVRTDGYPYAENLVGKEKSGSTSLVITAKEDVDVTFYYNRQTLEGACTENDNKDIIVFDQAAIDTKLTGEFTVVEILSGNSYANATKKVALKKDHVYTVAASGTTLQLHGVKLEEHVPVMKIAGAWNVKDEEWVLNDMKLAENGLTATYEVELAKGEYEFKVIKDGAWLTKANDGAFGLHRDYPGVAGVTDNASNNLKVTADAAGKHLFTWTMANDSIGIDFPAKPKFFITGDSALIVDAGLTVDKKWAPDAIKSEAEEYVIEDLKAGQEYKLKITLDGDWGTVKSFDQLSEKPAGLSTDGDNNICFKLAEAGDLKITYKVVDEKTIFTIEGNFYYEIPAKYYITGDSAFIVDAGSDAAYWAPDAIRSDAEEYVINNLKAGVPYMMQLTLDGDWGTVKGYDQLTEVPAGVTRGESDEFKDDDNNICFMLAEAGDLKITYKVVDENTIFTVEGNFYYEIPAKFYITGDSALIVDAGSEAAYWAPNAIKSEAEEYVIENLKAGQEYKLKITLDGDWGTAKSYDQLSEKPAGLSTDGDNNICFKLAEAGNVKVTYKVVDEENTIFKVEGNFYVEPMKELRIVPRKWTEANAKIAAWIWNEETEFATWTDFFTPIKEGNDTLSVLVKESIANKADKITFVRLYEWVSEPAWGEMDVNVMSQTHDAEIQWGGTFTITDWVYGEWVAIPAIADGFYLISNKQDWRIYNLTEKQKFGKNEENEDEWKLSDVVLDLGDKMQVVKVESRMITKWYPGEDFTVTPQYVGKGNVYFRETAYELWSLLGGHAFIYMTEQPELPIVVLVGTMNEWVDSDPKYQFIEAANRETATLKVELEAIPYDMKIKSGDKWLTQYGEEEHFVLHREWTTVTANVSIDAPHLVLHADVPGVYTFTWTYADSSLVVEFPALPEEGYYVAGDFTNWMKNMVKMVEVEDTYQAAIELGAKENHQFQIVKVTDKYVLWIGAHNAENQMKYGNCTDWPLTDDDTQNINLQTTTATSYMFSFVPEGYKLSVEIPEGPTNIDNTEAAVKAVKVLRNGQLFIMKGDKTYTVMGVTVQ